MIDMRAHDDELLTVAFSLQTNPGAYALLIGAGVSAPSGIPSAWGVLEDLIGRAANMRGETPDSPTAWYEEQFGEAATYEGVLERLAPKQIERQRLLRAYFEQDPEDRDAGRKTPTAAHRAITRMVAAGTIKVILTLNFDHLIERALREQGIEPTVIATPADIEGMAPLHTLDCCVIHLHGDYLSPTSMLNTVTELKAYHPHTAKLLAAVLENYGLIIAGWSSRYDPALREAIAAHYPSRFTMTWFEPGTVSEEAANLRALKKGLLLATDADQGFGRLADNVDALSSRRARHPLAVSVAIETAKRELSGRPVAIGLHDTVRREFARLHQLPEFHLVNHQDGSDYEGMLDRVEEATKVTSALIATLAYWGDDETDRWWLDEMLRFTTPVEGSGLTKLLSLRLVTGTALFYAAGITAAARQRFDLLGRLLALRRANRHSGKPEPLAIALDGDACYGEAQGASTRLFNLIAPLLTESLSLGQDALDDAWQQFEVLRLSWATAHSPGFLALRKEYEDKREVFFKAELARSHAQQHASEDLAATQTALRQAWQDQDRVLGQLSRLIPVGRPHLLAADQRVEANQRYECVTAVRLLQDLEFEREAHPLVASQFITNSENFTVALKAVSTAVGMIGHDLAWQRISGVEAGIVPNQIWLDTGKTPGELARESQPSAATTT